MNAPSTPAQEGFFMPPEWAPHTATWLSWPKNPETWPQDLKDVEEVYCQMIQALTLGERVRLLVDNLEEQIRVSAILKKRNIDLESVQFFHTPTQDVWIRDYGPNFIVQNTQDDKYLGYNRWRFNAWGGKYEDLAKDDGVLDALAPFLKIKRFAPGIILEGGSIEVNGEGVCLTTKQCLLNPNRNSHLELQAIETCLKNYLGVKKVLWLDKGIAGDDTDGHVDDIARFVNPRAIVTVYEKDPQDDNYKVLEENLRALEKMTDVKGESFRLVKLPMPRAQYHEDVRLPASYANFYIANKCVLVPTFQDPEDRQVLGILDNLFPTRRIVGIDCRVMVRGLGTLHCATQQEPSSSTISS